MTATVSEKAKLLVDDHELRCMTVGCASGSSFVLETAAASKLALLDHIAKLEAVVAAARVRTVCDYGETIPVANSAEAVEARMVLREALAAIGVLCL